MHVELYHCTEELLDLFRKEKNRRIAVKIHAVYLALIGKTTPQIVKLLGYSRRSIQRWVALYNRCGLAGLKDDYGTPNASKLNDEQLQLLRQRLEDGPGPEDNVNVFHGRDIQRIIKQQFGVDYHLSSVYRILHKLGYSYVSSRPEHPKGNPEKRVEFKKKLAIRSGSSVLIHLEKI